MTLSKLDAAQILQTIFDESSGALQVTQVSGSVIGAAEIKDGATTTTATVLPGSTAPQTTDTSLVVAISPNSTLPVSATNLDIRDLAFASDKVDASGSSVSVSSSALPTGAATSALQTTGNTSLSSIDGKIPSNLTVTSTRLLVDGSGVTQPISAASLPLPSGAATEATLSSLNGKVTAVDTGNVTVSSSALPTGASTAAKQDTGNTSLASIDSKVPANLTVTSTRLLVDGSGVTQPISAASLPLPSGAATEATLSSFSNKTAAALVPEAFDYQAITYVAATTRIDTVTYKLGGSGGTTVATLTLGYDGSDRLTSVTKT